MIWLNIEVAAELDNTVHGLHKALQRAVELEHSTIPPYLYALYSLKPGTNQKIAEIISSVVAEEMLHMALAANVLNAVGGAPQIDSPKFVPCYPGALPGGVESNLRVNLALFSIDVLTETFMIIEEPEKRLEFPVLPPHHLLDLNDFPLDRRPITIGEFYRRIIRQMADLGASIFTGDPRRQLTASFARIPLFAVTDQASAEWALRLIINQGEGTKTSPLDLDNEPAHFYRFAEIYKGFTLIPNPCVGPDVPPFVFGGDPVPFDAGEVWPAICNPKTHSYERGSAADLGNRDCNRTYTRLLKTLHSVFNGEPDRIAVAQTEMRQLRRQTQHLMSLPVGSVNAGPSFEYDSKVD